MRPVKVYAVINQKGGVGKTTTVANLGAVIASRGYDTCLIDLDPQAHLTLHFGVEPAGDATSIYEVLTSGDPLGTAATELAPHLSLVPSVIDLAAAEVELAGEVGREQILRDALVADSLGCQIVIIDCPPSLGLLTLNALAAADEVLVPLQPHFLALHGMGKLLQTISLVRQRINPKLTVAGIILCMYETTTRLAGEVAADLSAFLEAARDTDVPWSHAKIFSSRIRRNIKLAECPSHGKTIFDYDDQSIGAQDYMALAEEFISLAFGDGSYIKDHLPAKQDLVHASQEPILDSEPQDGAHGALASPVDIPVSQPTDSVIESSDSADKTTQPPEASDVGPTKEA